MRKAKGNTSEEGFAASGLTVTKEDVKAGQVKLGIRTSAKTKELVANMRNEYAQKIMAYCGEGCPPALKAVALSYAQELPMASRGRDIQNFKAACEAKLDAFRGTAQRMGLGEYLIQMERNNQARFDLGEASADLRQAETELTIVETGQAVTGAVNEHTDEVAEGVKNEIHKEGAANRAETRRQGRLTRGVIHSECAATRQVVHNEAAAIKQKVDDASDLVTDNVGTMIGTPGVGRTKQVSDGSGGTKEVRVVQYSDGREVEVDNHDTALGRSDDNTDLLTRNVGSMLGIPSVGETRKVSDGNGNTREEFVVTDTKGNKTGLQPSDTVNGHVTDEANRVNAHTTKEHQQTRLQNQQQAVLDQKARTLHMMLNHEENTLGLYRDSTVKWLGNAADRVMAGTDLSFTDKKAALDELTRMVDEENVISDADKAEFEATYFRRTQERPHL